jgi:pimeloyl-ACP methyl ester carboxylesterase
MAQEPLHQGYVSIEDILMYYEEHGEGEPVLLLHGGTGSGKNWSKIVPILSTHYRLIIPDSRAQGRSTDSDRPIDYDLLTGDVISLMDYLNIESAYVIGASDGGIIGLNLAMRYSDRVRKVVAYGANFHPGGLTDRQREWMENVTPENYGDADSDYLSIAPEPDRFGILLEKIKAMWLSEPEWTEADLSWITTPVLIIDDTLGLAIRPDHVRAMATAIPGARLAFVDDTDHYAYWDKPAEFSSLVLSFFADR